MPSIDLVRSTPVARTPRVMQLEGMFDLPSDSVSKRTWKVSFELPPQWHIGVIVGPSGSGKSTVAHALFGAHIVKGYKWPKAQSILDGFPEAMPIKEIIQLLSSVGFSSPPSWLRPFHVLSNGERFRSTIARALAETKPGQLCAVDEFTSVVDRTVAKIGSAAIGKTVRRRKQQFIAVSCHYDIVEWLEPDWIYQPHLNRFELPRGSIRRPRIELEVCRVHSPAWEIFRAHHYLNHRIHAAARLWVASIEGQPAACTAVIHAISPGGKTVREHRTVCLPDFQGVGIGNRLSALVGSAYRGIGFRFISCTTHPALTRYRAASKDWLCKRKPGLARPLGATAQLTWEPSSRLTSTWEYVGPAMRENAAWRFIHA